MKCRKKPIIIDAWRYDGSKEKGKFLIELSKDSKTPLFYSEEITDSSISNPILNVKTLEGIMTVNPGNYVLKGVQGEFYPCTEEIFKLTYEVINE